MIPQRQRLAHHSELDTKHQTQELSKHSTSKPLKFQIKETLYERSFFWTRVAPSQIPTAKLLAKACNVQRGRGGATASTASTFCRPLGFSLLQQPGSKKFKLSKIELIYKAKKFKVPPFTIEGFRGRWVILGFVFQVRLRDWDLRALRRVQGARA